MNVQIRLASIEDIPALQTLIRESVTTLSAGHYTTEQIASALSHVFGVDTQLIVDRTYFVAVIGDEIVGSGGWSKRKTLFGGDQLKHNQLDALLDPDHDAARIRAFYVHPRWSRKGIARRILNACEDAARAEGFSKVELVATLPGVPFYFTSGYEKGEPMNLEIADGESLPAFRMTKDLWKRA